MNALKTFAKVIYATGFTYTFGQTFYDGVRHFNSEKFENARMTDYALHSSAVAGVGIFGSMIWPLTLTTKFLVERGRKQ